jgi:RNA polymerase sigma factor (sigma-70 family)
MATAFRGSGVPAEDSQEPVWADWSTFTDIFREYAEYVFEYCISLLSDEGEAAGATTVTFITAQALLGHLENHDRLEAWLYALARRECTSKRPARRERLPEGTGFGAGGGAGAAGTAGAGGGAGAAGTAGAGGGAGATAATGLPRRNTERARTAADDDTDELDAFSRTSERKTAARQALSAFSRLPEEDREVLAAFSALSARDREVLDLVYWHGLSAVELPAILDISPQRAQTLLAAAVRRFREAAEDIQAASDNSGNSGNSGQEAEGSGDKLAATLPVARMPAAVWRRASRAVFDPDLRAYRDSVIAHAGRLRPDGFPTQPAAPGARAQTLKVSAVVLVPAAAGLALLLYLAGSSSGAPSGQVALTPGGHSTAAGVHRPGSAGAARGRHGALPVTSLFPGQHTHGVLPVASPGPSSGSTRSPAPSTGSSAPSSQPSSISKPPPSKSANPTPSVSTTPLPTPTVSTLPTPTTSPTSAATSPSATSTSSPTSVVGVIERLVPLSAIERFLT